MIAEGCNQHALVGFRSGRRRGCALRLFDYHPSAGCDEIEFTKLRKNVSTNVVLERRVNENQTERIARASEFAQRAMHIGHDQSRPIGEFELCKIGANRRRRFA